MDPNQPVVAAKGSYFWPLPGDLTVKVAHLHVAEPNVYDPWGRAADENPLGAIGVLRDDDQVVDSGISPKLRIAPTLTEVAAVDAIVSCPQREAIGEIDINEVAGLRRFQATRLRV